MFVDAVLLLIDADARTLKQTKPIIEAAKNGESVSVWENDCWLLLDWAKLVLNKLIKLTGVSLWAVIYTNTVSKFNVAYCNNSHTVGRKEIIEILLEAGMDPNIFDTKKGECLQLILDYTRSRLACVNNFSHFRNISSAWSR